MTVITPVLILAFLAITFLQSGYDKIIDWKGNVGWLKSHFAQTILAQWVPGALAVILITEMVAGITALVGIYQLVTTGDSDVALLSAILSSITLLLLLIGQRLAKDYDGARTIVIYYIPTLFLVYLLQG